MDVVHSRPYEIPDGFKFVSLEYGSSRAAISLGLIIRKEADPVAGHFIPIRQTTDANIFLGALCDQADQIIELVEVWVQVFTSFDAASIGYADTLNNACFDSRWEAQLKAMKNSCQSSCIDICKLESNLVPSFIDLESFRLVSLQDILSAGSWELCRDDTALELAQLPSFPGSQSRYLYQPQEADKTDFIPLTESSKRNEFTKEMDDLASLGSRYLPFNKEAGRLAARKLAHLDLKEFADLLGGQPWRGMDQAKIPFLPNGLGRTLQEIDRLRDGGEHLFRSGEGLAGRMAETFYLKLLLWEELFTLVKEAVKFLQTPFYSLCPDSFRVRLAGISPHLPYLWAFRAEIMDTPGSFVLPTLSPDTLFFKPMHPGGPSVYRPQALTESIQSTGSLRLRKVRETAKGEVVLEGTLATTEKLDASKSDLVIIRIPLASDTLNVFAQISAEEGLAMGEVRFATLGQPVSPEARDALLACEGVPLPRVPFELMPIMRTPCDVYSLAVIGVEILLVNSTNTLPVALDESLSLARQVAVGANPGRSLHERLDELFKSDPRWRKSLGPHRLLVEEISVEDASGNFPTELWTQFLSVLVRCFPGIGPDSCYADFGAVSPFALQNAFDEPLDYIGELRRKTRSLILLDWSRNQEIGEILKEFTDIQVKSSSF